MTIGLVYTAYTCYMVKSTYQISIDTLLIYSTQSNWYIYTFISQVFCQKLMKQLRYILMCQFQRLLVIRHIQTAR